MSPRHARDQVQRPGPGQESVWDYPRPPRLESVSQRIRVEHRGVVIADTARAMRVLETASPPTYYLPPDDIRMDMLMPSLRRSFCEWKGAAVYYSLRVGDRVVVDAAWSYPSPDRDFEPIAHFLAFYAGKVDACYVGNDKARPQASAFYGGWITPNILGPFKGEAGTEGW
jgi:uncharacterized protein (DUF427 family)